MNKSTVKSLEDSLEFNEKTFKYLLQEYNRLYSQRIKDLMIISDKTNKIIELQDKIIEMNGYSSDISYLKVSR